MGVTLGGQARRVTAIVPMEQQWKQGVPAKEAGRAGREAGFRGGPVAGQLQRPGQRHVSGMMSLKS